MLASGESCRTAKGMLGVDELLRRVIDAHGGLDRWERLRGLTATVSIGGPLWTSKGWTEALSHDETVYVDTGREFTIFTPFIARGQRAVFEAQSERVQIVRSPDVVIDERTRAREGFKAHLRGTAWDRLDLAYFIGYLFWNQLTAPFLFTYPGVRAQEIEPWRESGQTWRRLLVRFPPNIATHCAEQVFYFDRDYRQRRTDYVIEVLGSCLEAQYVTEYSEVDGLMFATRHRSFRRNPGGSSNLNVPSITVDISNVELHLDEARSGGQAR
jgi:hypothetical protein